MKNKNHIFLFLVLLFYPRLHLSLPIVTRTLLSQIRDDVTNNNNNNIHLHESYSNINNLITRIHNQHLEKLNYYTTMNTTCQAQAAKRKIEYENITKQLELDFTLLDTCKQKLNLSSHQLEIITNEQKTLQFSYEKSTDTRNKQAMYFAQIQNDFSQAYDILDQLKKDGLIIHKNQLAQMSSKVLATSIRIGSVENISPVLLAIHRFVKESRPSSMVSFLQTQIKTKSQSKEKSNARFNINIDQGSIEQMLTNATENFRKYFSTLKAKEDSAIKAFDIMKQDNAKRLEYLEKEHMRLEIEVDQNSKCADTLGKKVNDEETFSNNIFNSLQNEETVCNNFSDEFKAITTTLNNQLTELQALKEIIDKRFKIKEI